MKVWKLVSGILSIVLSVFVVLQSGAAGMVNAMEGNGEVSGTAGILVAVMLLVGGIVSIASRKGGKGGNIAEEFHQDHRRQHRYVRAGIL